MLDASPQGAYNPPLMETTTYTWKLKLPDGEVKREFPEPRMRGGTLLQRLDLRREEVILIRNGEVITEKDWVTHEDEVEVIRVISGG